MVIATYISLRTGLDLPVTDVMENIDPEKVSDIFRTDFEPLRDVDANIGHRERSTNHRCFW